MKIIMCSISNFIYLFFIYIERFYFFIYRTLKEDRIAIIADQCDYAPFQIFHLMKNLNITKGTFISPSNDKENSSVKDR